jgi:putative ABC transport system permease protein
VFRERRFKWLLWLLPGSFREEHEREIVRLWQEEARDAAREGRRGAWMDAVKDTMRAAPREYASTWSRNVRFAGRSLWRARAFAVSVVLTIALGTGATAAVFTLINGVLLRPLPWVAPDRIGIIWAVQPSGQRTWVSFAELQELQRDVSGLAVASGFLDLRPSRLVDGVGHEVEALAVSHQFFGMLGVSPTLGRDFSPEDDRNGAAPVAILSHGFWLAQFGANPAVVGSRILLNERDYSVIGVLPASFTLLPASSVLPEQVGVWLPLEPHLPSRDRSVRFLHVLARLAPEVTYASVARELESYAARAGEQFTTVYRGGSWGFSITSFKDDVLSKTRTALYLVVGLVVLVLLMACSNVANLLLARGEARRGELAVRVALGAGPARLTGELLAEAFVLATIGGALGLGLASAAPMILRSVDPGALPRLAEATVDLRVAAFAAGFILISTAIFASAPLIERLRFRGAAVTMPGRSGGRTRRSASFGKALVVVQTALATTVLITALFLAQSFFELQQAELGFAAEKLLTTRMSLSARYSTGAQIARLYDSAIRSVEQVPGVAGAAAVTQLPLSGTRLGSSFFVEAGPDARRVDADLRGVSAKYFQIMRIPLLQGRLFTTEDSANVPAVAVVDETFARRLSPDAHVVGRRIRWFRQPDVEIEIVGVVRAVRHRGSAQSPRETVYRPHPQYPRPSMFLVARTHGDPGEVTNNILAAVRAVDPSQPLADVFTMEQRRERNIGPARTTLLLGGALAGLAMALGLVGLYGILSYGVAQRLREFAVRMSFGAASLQIGALVVKEGAILTITGSAIGVASAAAVAFAVRGTLHGTGVLDVRQYAVGTAAVLLSSVAAFWLPARRASAADPLAALRADR